MKLSELKPCARCHGPLPPIWYVVRTSVAILDEKATRGVLGLHTMFGDSAASLRIAEVMAPAAEKAVIIAGDDKPELMNELFLCSRCYLMEDVNLCRLVENQNEEPDHEKAVSA